ncbi:MAG: prepilin-type N-terminal cleavage/methylation domain-containing protein [Deltaproteobacteria bacterium]|nr:prepilin-type N-terminal cleavage/methylation domain-containing protein [Deltaproteobacteria bacterium]
MKRFSIYKGRDKGVTMVELLIYIALMGITSTALYSVLIGNIKAHDSIETTLVMNQDVRGAMNLMVREIRQAGLSPKEIAGIGFQQDADDRFDTDANSFHFTADINNNAAIGGSGEDVCYYIENDPGTNSDALWRRTDYGNAGALTPQMVIPYVTNWQVQYLAQDGATAVAAPNGTNVFFVDITLQAQTSKNDALTGNVKTQTMQTRVRVRNAGL